MVEAFRILTMLLVLAAMCWLPGALKLRVPTRRMWLVLVALELQLAGACIVIVQVLHQPLVWYRTPRIFVSAVLLLIYCWLSYRDFWGDRGTSSR